MIICEILFLLIKIVGLINGIDSPSNIHYLAFPQRQDQEKEMREGEGQDAQSEGHIENSNTYVADSYELSCEVIRSELIENGHYDNNDNPVDELEDLWRDMSVALACSKVFL
jgi:hypothetical protein